MDWIIASLSLIGVVANIYNKAWCFILWIITNSFWCIYDLRQGLYSQAILFAVYMLLAVFGLYKWAKNGNEFKLADYKQALIDLLALKDYKTINGKDEYYLKHQPELWNRVRLLLK